MVGGRGRGDYHHRFVAPGVTGWWGGGWGVGGGVVGSGWVVGSGAGVWTLTVGVVEGW